MDVLAPMQRARVSTAAPVKTGAFRRTRIAYRRSRTIPPLDEKSASEVEGGPEPPSPRLRWSAEAFREGGRTALRLCGADYFAVARTYLPSKLTDRAFALRMRFGERAQPESL